MDLCPIRMFFQRNLPFWQTCPKVNFAMSSYFYLTKKSLVLHVGPLFKNNHSDRACRVVHSSPCCMLHTSLCTVQRACRVVHSSPCCMLHTKARNSAVIFIFSYRLPAVHGDDIIMPLAIIGFPRARYNYYIILTAYSSKVQKLASFPGRLLLRSLDRICDLWTARRSGRRPGSSSTSSNRKVDSIMTYVDSVSVIMAMCPRTLLRVLLRTFTN